MISVIIPVYNRPKLLVRAVESVLQQSYKDFELIVVDDGSTKNHNHVAELLVDRGHQFIRIEQSGVAQARNEGVQRARGKWVAFLDSDDAWRPSKLERQLEFHNSNPELRISQCEEVWNRSGRRVNKRKIHEMPDGEAFYQSLRLCCISPSSVLIDRSLFCERGGFDRRFPVCEDYDFWLRLTHDHKVGLIREPQVEKYGGHDDQLSKSQPAIDRFRLFSLIRLLMREQLTAQQLRAVLLEVRYKSHVLFKGSKRRELPFSDLYETLGLIAQEGLRCGAPLQSVLQERYQPLVDSLEKVALSTRYPEPRIH